MFAERKPGAASRDAILFVEVHLNVAAPEISEAARGSRGRALLTFADIFTRRETSAAAGLLGLRGPTPTAPALARDKSAVRRALDEAGLPNVRWAVADLRRPVTTS